MHLGTFVRLAVAVWAVGGASPLAASGPGDEGARAGSKENASAGARQFDPMIGEWEVQNRHLQPGGVWVKGSRTRARYTPVLDGAGLLEEWAGPFSMGSMYGFSLRAWNPELATWEVALFWTMDGNANFGGGAMRGVFRNGRGEFFTSPTGTHRTRFTFSESLPGSARWDSATTSDGGMNWSTDWIMEFRRTGGPDRVGQDVLFGESGAGPPFSPHPEARQLDGLLGSWSGAQTLADGTERDARLRARLVSRDCLVVDLFETRARFAEVDAAWTGRLFVRGFCMPAQRWEGWALSQAEPGLRPFMRAASDDGVVFAHTDKAGTTWREKLVFLDDDWIVVEEEVQERGASSPTLVATTELQRLP